MNIYEQGTFFDGYQQIALPCIVPSINKEVISTYQRMGKNKYDDAADTLTGVAEMVVDSENEIKVL